MTLVLCHKRKEIPSDPPSFCSVCRDYSCPLVLLNDCKVFVAELPAPSTIIIFFFVFHNETINYSVMETWASVKALTLK